MKKTFLIISGFSFLLAACQKSEPKKDPPTPTVSAESPGAISRIPNLAESSDSTDGKSEATAVAMANPSIDSKITPVDTHQALPHGGRVVRQRTAAAGSVTGEIVDNARVVASINAKLIADTKLSALKIGVAVNQGVVTLTGTVKNTELMGRAVGLALGTDGVIQVVSLLTVDA